jgi:hypothetical protein
VAEFAAGHAGRETEVADRYLLVDKRIGEVVRSLGHGSNKNTNALLLPNGLYIISDSYKWGIEA